MTSQIELIKAHVLNRLADAAEPLGQVKVDNGTGLTEFESVGTARYSRAKSAP
jgi:hypothetical protein